MSVRLQVILDEREMRAIRKDANQQGMTVSEWVRQALRAARRESPLVAAASRPAVVRAAVRQGSPTTEVRAGRVGEASVPYGSGDAEALRPFVGRWVAVKNGEVLVAADAPGDVLAWLRRHNRRGDAMFRVPVDPAVDLGGFPG